MKVPKSSCQMNAKERKEVITGELNGKEKHCTEKDEEKKEEEKRL